MTATHGTKPSARRVAMSAKAGVKMLIAAAESATVAIASVMIEKFVTTCGRL